MNASASSSGQPLYTALVLAGERGGDNPVAAAAGVRQKCWVPAAGVPMLVRVVQALSDSAAVGRIVVSMSPAEAGQEVPVLDPNQNRKSLEIVPCAATPATSVLTAVEALEDPFPLLVTTADHPLLTAAIVDHFCAACVSIEADIVAGLTPARVITAAYPQTRRTYLKFRDGPRSGANLFTVRTSAGLQAVDFWRRVEQQRKRPWRIARAFGIWNLGAYLCGWLTVERAMGRVSRVLGTRAVVVDVPFAEAAIDVDKPDDLALVEQILRRREQDQEQDYVHAGSSF